MRSEAVILAALWVILEPAVVSPDNQKSKLFTTVRPGQKPIAGVWQLATYTAMSRIKCANTCWNNGSNVAGCGGFLYQPDSCSGSSAKQILTGECQLLAFFQTASLLYGPADSSCQQFFVSNVPVAPRK
jgi:hypothetical protein